MLTKSTSPQPKQISEIDVKGLADAFIERAADDVRALYEALGGNDQIAKGSELRARIVQAVAGGIQHVTAQ